MLKSIPARDQSDPIEPAISIERGCHVAGGPLQA